MREQRAPCTHGSFTHTFAYLVSSSTGSIGRQYGHGARAAPPCLIARNCVLRRTLALFCLIKVVGNPPVLITIMTSKKAKIYCGVFGCLNNDSNKPDLSFFTIPTEQETRLQWLRSIDREDLSDKPIRRILVCEVHFKAEDIFVNSRRKLIKKNCSPCLHLPKNKEDKVNNTPVNTTTTASTQTDIPTCSVSCETQKINTIYELLVFNQAAPSTSTTEQQPSTSAAEELQYKPSRYSIVSGNELPPEAVICQECFLRLNVYCSNGNMNAEREFGHTHVCVGCGRSLLEARRRVRHHTIDVNHPLIATILSWDTHNEVISRNATVCHLCWVRASRQLSHNAIRIQADTDHEQVDSEQLVAPQEAIPTPPSLPLRQEQQSALVEEIVIKEEITDEEKNQCRLCLSVGRRMQELGEYAPLYRKLLFENSYQHTTIPSFMFSMLACWECIAELRRVKRFQEKVRRANNAFETNQNQKCENLSNLSTILIGDYKNPNAGENQPASVEDCAQDIKEEAVEAEVEETSLPDPLAVEPAVEPDVPTPRQESDIYLEIEHEPNTSITPKKVVKRPIPQPKPNQRQPKRTKLDQNVENPEPMRAELDQSGSKTTEEENHPKPVAEIDCDAIFGKVKVEIDELEKILTERRNKESFKSMKFKCDSCILGFTDHNRLLDHNRNFHDEEVGSCECDICERRFDDDSLLSAHYRNHFVKFVCKLCNFECYTKTGRTIHFKRHKGALQGTSLEALLRKKLAGVTSRQSSS